MPDRRPGRAARRRRRGSCGATAWPSPVVRAVLRLRRPARAARAAPKVTILLVHAWGMGGTIRTMLNVAGRLAERHEVEVVSVWRTRERAVLRRSRRASS